MKWIDALDLDRWADTICSRTSLSELVSSLVRASVSEITDIRFPTGDSAQAPGYDGTLEAKGVPPFVPDRKSVWEFGVDSDCLAKAEYEYSNRTEKPRGVTQSETVFVFVTPRHWKGYKQSLEEWQEAKTKAGVWRGVRAIDGVGLESWLETCAAVAARIAREMLRIMPANGARSTDEYWEEYSSRFNPRLCEDALLCGREKQADLMRQQLIAAADAHSWQADSPEEVVAFTIAAIRRADPKLRKFLEARTLVVDTEDAARQLGRSRNMIFLPRAQAVDQVGLLANCNPTVVALGRKDPKLQAVITLERPISYAMGKSFEGMGVLADDSILLARKCGCSVTILAKLIPRGTGTKPEWDGKSELVPALIAGAWDASSPDDRTVVQTLAGMNSYEEYEDKLLPYLRMEDPVIERVGTVWKMRAPVVGFLYLGSVIGTQHLERFEQVSRSVFSEIDPALDLTDTERPYASLKGATFKHSEWLRDGLATALLLFAVYEEQANLYIRGGAQAFVDRLIKELPGLNENHRLLASLQHQLPLLMEAAPRPFLSALEQLLGGDGIRIKPIFADTEDALFTQSPHTGLLWGLETLAWDPQYLSQVSLILAGLTRVDDPPGKLLNRPINSLREIFLPWNPGTNATVSQRLGVLDQLVNQEPPVAWKLLLMLMPEFHSVSQPTAKPRYREAGASEREPRTNQLVWDAYSGAIDRALTLAGADAQRWSSLVQSFPNFDPPHLDLACQLLEKLSDSADSTQRIAVWSALNGLINRNKAFRQAAWAMDKSRIERLEEIAARLQPSDPLVRAAWLFNDYYPALPDDSPTSRFGKIDQLRVEAITELLSVSGASAVIALTNQVKFPRLVAATVSQLLEDADQFDSWVDSSLGPGGNLDEFAVVISSQAVAKLGEVWKSRITARFRQKRYTSVDIATLLLGWPDDAATFEFAASFGSEVEGSYWQRKPVWPLQGSTEEVEKAIKKYVSAERAVATLRVIWTAAANVSANLILELLDAVVEEIRAFPDRARSIAFYELEEIFEALQSRSEVPKIEIAKREYAFLPWLEHSAYRLTLVRVMAENPGFFVSILCDVFKRANAGVSEADEAKKGQWLRSYGLLEKFNRVPGEQGGDIEPDVLEKWVTDVRRLAAEEDRAQIADLYVGHTLAHAPADKDGAWPHCAVRNLLEKLHSTDVERGIETERHNMRGVVTKAMFEGGDQERALAGETRSWAKTCEKWPHTHGMLLRLAEWWEAWAGHEDERAQQDKMKYQ